MDSLQIIDNSQSSFAGEATIEAQDFILAAGARLNGDARSHLGTDAIGHPTSANKGAVHASTGVTCGVYNAFASHPYAIRTTRPSMHGSVVNPRSAGSPGTNAANALGGKGGAALKLTVERTTLIDGEISANGAAGGSSGAGAGGSIDITTRLLRQSTGIIRADGGASSTCGGSAGGGRVALKCQDSEYVSYSDLFRPLGVRVQAEGQDQGPGTIWYDCGGYRSTLRLDLNPSVTTRPVLFLDVSEFEGKIIREIQQRGNLAIVATTTLGKIDTPFNLRYGVHVTSDVTEIFGMMYNHKGNIYPRSFPHPDSESCYDYIVRAGCTPRQLTHAVFRESLQITNGALLYLPNSSEMLAPVWVGDNDPIGGVQHLVLRAEITGGAINVNSLFVDSGATVINSRNIVTSSILHMAPNSEIRFLHKNPVIQSNNFYMAANSLIYSAVQISNNKPCTIPAALASFAGCSSTNNCLAVSPPYGGYDEMNDTGSANTCTSPAATSNLIKIVSSGKFSFAGTIQAQVDKDILTSGGAVHLQLNDVVHTSGKIDISGTVFSGAGGSGGRAMVTCNSDPYHSIFHLKVNADGGCINNGCGATGTVFFNCGYYQNYLKVIATAPRPFRASPTHIIVPSAKVLDAIEASADTTLHFKTKVANAAHTLEIKRILSTGLVSLEKSDNLRLRVGQQSTIPVPTSASVNALLLPFNSQANTMRTQYNNALQAAATGHQNHLKVIDDISQTSAALLYCKSHRDMCLSGNCSGETTRFTRTGKEKVSVRMNVETFKNPLDVQTAKVTLENTLVNFYGIPKDDVRVVDVMESGTRILNVTVNVQSDVTGKIRKELLRTSAAIDDSPVESCFKRVNL